MLALVPEALRAQAGVLAETILASTKLLGGSTFLEMKRRKGGGVTGPQEAFRGEVAALGCEALVARGAEEALASLKELGYL